MIRRLVRNWLLLLAGALQAVFAVLNLLMQDPDAVTLRRFMTGNTTALQAKLALAAGICTIAAGVWRSGRGKFWLLVLNGLALGVYGLLPVVWGNRPLYFRPYFALLLVMMAMSIGILALESARTLHGHVPDKWLLGLAGTASVGFALAFFALDFRWIALERPGSLFLLLASFFSLCAICMIGLALRLNGAPASIHSGHTLHAG